MFLHSPVVLARREFGQFMLIALWGVSRCWAVEYARILIILLTLLFKVVKIKKTSS